MKKLISNIAIIIALVVTSVSYSNAQHPLFVFENTNTKCMINLKQTGFPLPGIFSQIDTDTTKLDFNLLLNYKYSKNNLFVGSLEADSIVYRGGDTTTLYISYSEIDHRKITIKTFNNPTTGTASVKEVEVSNFSVYPNPVVDVLNIKFDAYEDVNVVVMDMSGRIVYNEPTSTMTTVNMSDQPSGMYLVKIGNQTQTFVKK